MECREKETKPRIMKTIFCVVNKKLGKLWKLNRLETLKSYIIFNAFVVLWRKSVSFEPFFEKKITKQIEKLITKHKHPPVYSFVVYQDAMNYVFMLNVKAN